MTLEDLGYTPDLENYRKEQKLDSFGVGRVISEHKERYLVKTEENEYDAEIIGNLRFSASIFRSWAIKVSSACFFIWFCCFLPMEFLTL